FLLLVLSSDEEDDAASQNHYASNGTPEQALVSVPTNEDVRRYGDTADKSVSTGEVFGACVSDVARHILNNDSDTLSRGLLVDHELAIEVIHVCTEVSDLVNKLTIDINLDGLKTDSIEDGILNGHVLSIDNCLFQA